MKNLAIVILALFLAVLLFGCTEDPDINEETEVTSENKESEIEVKKDSQEDKIKADEVNILKNSSLDEPLDNSIPSGTGALNSNKSFIFHENSGGEGSASIKDGELKVDVINEGINDYSVQIIQSPVKLKRLTPYTVSFDAKGSSELNVSYKVGAISSNQWVAYGQESIKIDGEMKNYSFDFQMQGVTDEEARFELWLLNEGEYTFDNIKILEGETKKVEELAKPDLGFYTDDSLTIDEKVDKLLGLMTLEEKIGQMLQGERNGATPEAVRMYKIGSILSGGGSVPGTNTPKDWIEMYNSYQEEALETRLEIPIIYGVDAVHGHNNLKDATIFPHNVGLGAMAKGLLAEERVDEAKALMYNIGAVTATEATLTGMDWNFAPAVSVARDERWGRAYESYGEDPELQEILVSPYIKGLQGDENVTSKYNMLATAKHFIGDGGTEWGTGTSGYQMDRGDVNLSIEELKTIHMQGYIEAIEANVASVMASYNSYKGTKMHGHELITTLLKDELGFKGVVVSDWEGVDEINSPTRYDKIVLSANAGIDMFMEPYNWLDFLDNLTLAVKNGDVSEERINDAVRRILTMKFKANLFEKPLKAFDEKEIKAIGSDEHRSVAREAVRKSAVLLKNNDRVLPLSSDEKIYLLGKKANNIGIQSGGWTIEWQGFTGNKRTTGTTIKDGFIDELQTEDNLVGSIDEADKIVVVVGELTYAEGKGDTDTLKMTLKDYENLDQAVESGKEVVVVMLAGRPLIITEYIDKVDSFVMAWLPGTEGNGITDLLFGHYNFSGKLPVTWPKTAKQEPINIKDNNYDPLYEYGFGLKLSID